MMDAASRGSRAAVAPPAVRCPSLPGRLRECLSKERPGKLSVAQVRGVCLCGRRRMGAPDLEIFEDKIEEGSGH